MSTVIPNQRPSETIEERLRRLTKEALNGGGQNKFGPANNHPSNVNPALQQIPGGVPQGGPDAVIHRIAREASTRVPNYGR